MAKFVLTAQIALQAPRNTSQVVNQIRKQLQGINVNINVNANTRALNNTNNQLNATAKSARAAEKSISELGKSLGIAARRFGAIAIATSTFLTLSRAIKTSLGDAIEFERQLVNLSQVTGKSVKDLRDISGEITRLSTGLGVSSDQLLRTSIILAQAGLEARKTKAALEVLAKTQLASSFDNIENTTEGAIAILSQFRKEAAAAGGDVAFLEQALGAINDVSKKFAVESADLVAVIRRSGGAFEAAGGSLNELLALFTSVRATTRESAETIATGLRTIFTRIQRVDTIRQLQELGIALQDAEGKFVGPFEAIKRISEGLSGLDPRDFRFAAIVEELGGFRQIGKVIPLIKQFAVAQDALNTAQGASGSLAKDAATAQQSLANEFARVREEFQALIRKLVDSESFNTVARGALEVARALIRITDAVEPLLPLIAGLAAFQIGKGFIPALGALTGVTKRNQGGKIHAFASGGFVPGVGNRDTVPAMMTPGEFVIRKSSAKKIGAARLQALNSGGEVDSLPSAKPYVLDPRQKNQITWDKDSGKTWRDLNRFNPNDKVNIDIERKSIDVNSLTKTTDPKLQSAITAYREATNPRDRGLKFEYVAANADVKFRKSQIPNSRFDGIKGNQPVEVKSRKDDVPNSEIYEKGIGAALNPFNFSADKIIQQKFNKNKLTQSQNDIDLGSVLLIEDITGPLANKEQRKNEAVQKSNLGGIIQKFAAGGIVDVIKGKQPVGILTTDDDSTAPYTVKPDYSESFRQQLAVAEPATMKQGEQLPNVNVNQFGLNQSAESGIGKRLRQNLITNAANAVNVTAGQMSDVFRNLGIGINANNLVPESEARKAITGSVVGTMFESLIRGVSNASGSDLKDSGYFDFIGPISDQAAQLFEKSGQINASNYKDAKSGAIKKQNIASKVINQAAEEYGMQGVLKSTTGNARTADSILKELTPQMRADFLDPTKGLTPTKLKPIYKAQNEKELLRLLEDKGLDVQTRPREGGGTLISVKVKDMKEMAVGGAASDTEPALLTPGEFVVSKTSAQEVGYSTLHKMNKTGKIPGYAKGGVVGYASGGPVTPSLSPAQPGQQVPKSLPRFEAIFDKIVQSGDGTATTLETLKKSIKEYKDIYGKLSPVMRAYLKTQLSAAKTLKQSELQQIALYKAQQQQIAKMQSFGAALSKTFGAMQNFVFLASAITATVSQFTSLDNATKTAVTETAAFASTTIAAVGTVGELGSTISGILPIGTKAKIVSTVLTGLSSVASMTGLSLTALLGPIAIVGAALAAFGLYLYYMQAQARANAEALRKNADSIAENIEKGKGGSPQEFVDLQVKAAKTLTDSYLSFGGTLEYLGFSTAKSRQEEIDAIQRSAQAYISVVQSVGDTEKKLSNIDLDKSLKPAEAAFKKIEVIASGAKVQAGVLSGPQSQVEEIKKLAARQGISKPVSQLTEGDFKGDNAKAQFKLANDAIVKITEEFQKRVPESISLLQAQLDDTLQSIDFSRAATQDINLDGLVDSFDTVLQQNQAFASSLKTTTDLILITAKAQADAARQRGNFVEAGNIEAAAKDQVKNLLDSQAKQAVAFEKSQQSAIAFQQALEANAIQFKALSATSQYISKLTDEAKTFGNRMSALNNIMSGELPSLEMPEIQGLSNLSDIKDLDKFKKQVGDLGQSMGPEGQKLAGQLTASAGLMEKAKRELSGINFAEISMGEGGAESAASTAFKKAFGNTLDTIFGAQTGGKLRTMMEKQLQDAIRTASEAGGMVDPAELEKILDPLKQMTEETRKMFEAYNQAQIEYFNQYSQTNKMLLDVMKQEIDGRQKIADIQNRGLERMDQATGRTPGFQEKEARRNASRGSRLNAVNLGPLIGNIKGMGNALREANSRLEKNSTIMSQNDSLKTNKAFNDSQRMLRLQADELKNSLEDLADQSDKASDVMSEIDKERGKRETFSKIVEGFVVGGKDERMSTARAFQGIEFAAATGSLQGLGEEDRKATFGLLEQLAAVDDGFKALKENLVAADAVRMGLDPQVAMAMATQTPKEQQLLAELQQITRDEIAAQQELNRINAEFGNKLSGELNNLSKKIDNLGSVIEQKFNQETSKATTEKTTSDQLLSAKKTESEEKAQAGAKVKETEQKLTAAKEKKSASQGTMLNATKEIQARQSNVSTANARLAGEDNPNRWGDAVQNVTSLGGALYTTSAMQQQQDAIAAVTQSQTVFDTASNEAMQADNEIKRLESELAQAKAEKQAIEDKYNNQTVIGKAKGGLIYRASGGSVFKPKGADTVPAMLTPGEFVMQKSAVDQYGLGAMNAINSGTMYAARGGRVRDVETFRNSSIIKNRIAAQQEMNKFKGENYNLSDQLGDTTMDPKLDSRDAYLKYAKMDLEMSKKAKQESMARLQKGPSVSATPYKFKFKEYKDAPQIPAAVPPPPKNETAATSISNAYGEADPKILKELGGTYGQGRNYDPRQQLALGQKRREAEMRKRDIRSGKINPMADRRKAIQEKLETRQGDIATSRYKRQQRSLPSYAREEGWENKRINPTQAKGAMQTAGMAQNPMMAQQPMMNPMMAQRAMANPMMAQQGQGMGAQGFNMEPLMQLKQTFDTLTGVLNNMQMTHQVNVDGSLNINGVNAPQVAEAIKTYLGEFIVGEVKKIIDKQGKDFKGQ